MAEISKISETVFVRWLGMSRIAHGIVEGVGAVAAAGAALMLVAIFIPEPSPALLGDLADIGTVLVLAYVVEAVWLVPRMVNQSDYENRLGAITGVGIAGMIGVVVAVLLAAHRTAGHANLLDDAGLAWIVSSLMILAGMVVAHPLLVDEWDSRSGRSGD